MKKILSILFSILTLTVIAQVPQGVGYQGVATDANGIELVNQSISIRASVLSGSASGTIEWEETHATSTDTFGLFTITIGQGTNTGNGVQADFADISWGTNTYFLKIEMDVNGGTNYAFMGTNQMMSVPYALYAESANINYDSISNFLSGDSTFITNVGSGMGGDGCDYAFPDGLYGEPVQIDLLNSNYTVPSGKNLYIISTVDFGGNTVVLTVNGLRHSIGSTPSIIKSGDEISYNWGANPSEVTIYGILIDAVIEPVQINLLNSNYTVPSGKNLYITSTVVFGGNSLDFTVNGFRYSIGLPPSIIKSGDELSYNWGANPSEVTIYGYLADENYFAGCGGGGSSSSSSLDSTAIANMIAAAGGRCSFKYPEGLNGDAITHELSNGNSYTVPAGKKLYILNHYSINDRLIIDNITISLGSNQYSDHSLANPVIASPGQVITTAAANASSFNGLLVNDITDVQAITHELQNGNSYTVPTGKKLYILNHYSINDRLIIDNITISLGSNQYSDHSLANPIIASSGQVITTAAANASAFNGYLVDENYFAGCGGGGSSSTSTLDSTAIANMIAAAGGSGCNWRFPDGLTGTPITWHLPGNDYTVPSGKNLYITAHSGNSNGENLRIDGFEMNVNNKVWNELIIVGAGSVVSTTSVTSSQWSNFNGILVDANVTPITWHLPGNDYTVPAGKNLYITAHSGNSNGENLRIDGFEMNVNNKTWNGVLIVGSGSVVSTTSVTSAQWSNFNGYLVDENYFADCGGGGSSLSSTLTNTSNFSYTNQSGETYVQNISQGDLFYLDGTLSFGQSNYFVVPSGKNLHIDYSDGSCETMEFYRNNILFDRLNIISKLEDLILTEGDSIVFGWITDPNCSSNSTVNYLMYGYLVDTDTLIQPLLVDITNNSYSVPLGKKLFVKETFGNFNAGFVTFPNGNISNMAYNWIQEIDFLESGTIIEVDPTSLCTPCIGYSYISGYLINE